MNEWGGALAVALYQKIKNDQGIGNIVSGRVYPIGGASSPELPYITYVCPLTDRDEYCYGNQEPQLVYPRLQVDGWARTYEEAMALFDAIFMCLTTAEITIPSWGTAKLWPDAAMGPMREETEDGRIIYRTMRRFWALLIQRG